VTEAYRHIDPTPYVEGLDPSLAPDLGPLPELRWIPISQLVIDPRYQRDIGRAGAKNVRRIAERFDWTKFGVTIVARLAEDLYAIVDGQHRTTGAAGRGIEAVPCLVIHADPKLQAESFAAINGAVTPMSRW